MVCPCRYLSKGLLFNMQHKEGQKTRNFKLDRTANCHHLCSWTMPFSTNEVKSSWQQIPKTLNTHLFSLLCSPPPPYPLREKEGTENYCVYASRNSYLTTFFPKKSQNIEGSDLWRLSCPTSHSSRDTMMSRKLGRGDDGEYKLSHFLKNQCTQIDYVLYFL